MSLKSKKTIGEAIIEEIYNETLNKLETLIENYDKLNKNLTKTEETYRRLESVLESLNGKYALSKTNKDDADLKLKSALESSAITSIEVLKDSHIEKK